MDHLAMELNDGQPGYVEEFQEFNSSDLTDSENGELDATCGNFSNSTRRCLKRRHDGVFVDTSAAVPERRSRRRIHEQFELLRAVLPDLCSNEKASILTGAYEYIEKLQKLEAELCCELDIIDSCGELGDVSCREVDEVSPSTCSSGAAGSETSSCSGHNCSQPTVEVERTAEGLKMHIECEKRPGLLLGMMEMLESSGLTVEQANIECAYQRLVFDGIGSEIEAANELGEERRDGPTCVSAEVVGARLRSVIGDQTQGVDSTDQEL